MIRGIFRYNMGVEELIVMTHCTLLNPPNRGIDKVQGRPVSVNQQTKLLTQSFSIFLAASLMSSDFMVLRPA